MKTDRNDNKKHIDTCKRLHTHLHDNMVVCVYVFKIAPIHRSEKA